MGFFKDIKNMRETAAEHGGMPDLRDARRDVSKLFDDRGEREILKSGVSAKAIVRGILMPVQGDRFAMQVPLEVFPPDGDSYQVRYVFPAVRMQAALSPGLEVPVKISTEDPNHIAVQWDAQKAAIAAAGGSYEAATEGLARTADPAAAEMFRQALAGQNAAAAPAAPDAESRLQQIEHLKQSGLIDDATYEAKRKQIIDEI